MIFERRNISSSSMDAVMFHGSIDRPISPYKSLIRNPTNKNQFFFYNENFHPSNFQNMGLLQAPPPLLSHSYPPYPTQQPPLLPLPTATPRHSAGGGGRGLSCPPVTKKTHNSNRAKDPSLTTKKSKSPTKSPKKEGKFSPKKSSSNLVIVSSNSTPLGPDPKELPKDVAKVLPFTSSNVVKGNSGIENNNYRLSSVEAVVEDRLDVFSGSVVFTISPPPSSLPLPTFSLRPKLSCNAEAAGVDTGATDNLRRLLRIL